MNNEINDKTYIPLTPFKGWVLENFPFIEADFDAITNYELLCLIVKYLNEVISNQNQVQELGTELVTAYNELLEYVNNYFNNLDVQDEINNKLDAMAQDGTLTNLIANYIDPLIEEQNNVIELFKDDVTGDLAEMQSQINSVVSGSPAGVYATVSALTTADPNHSKIYVVLADGKWYYYDTTTSTWTAGGTYQSTTIDPDSPNLINMLRGGGFLSGAGITEDNSNMNTITSNRVFLYYGYPNLFTNLPAEMSNYAGGQLIFNVLNFSYQSVNSNYKYQMINWLSHNKTYFRYCNNGTWSSWEIFINGIHGNAFYSDVLSNLTTTTSNMDNCTPNTINLYYAKPNDLTNIPDAINNYTAKQRFTFNIMTYSYINSANNFNTQLITWNDENRMFMRNKLEGGYSPWIELLTENNLTSELKSCINEPLDINNKSLTFTGDSITAGAFIQQSNSWANVLANKLNATFANKAVSGATFAEVTDRTQIITQITGSSNNQVLFIAGGVNDWANNVSKNDFTTALTNICEYLQQNYNGNVIFVTPINNIMTTVTNPISLNWYREEITRIALYYGYSVIAGNELGFVNYPCDLATLQYYDTVHPSVTGSLMMANNIYRILK